MAMRDTTRISKILTLRVYQRNEYGGICIYHAVIIFFFFRQSLAFRAGFKLAMYPRMTFNFRSSLQSALAVGISHVHVMLAVKS